MACSKYQYVKLYEQHRVALQKCYIVLRIDGRSFTRFCQANNFQKPNDLRAIKLMNQAAKYVCKKFKDIFMAYGQSDQYSFVLTRNAELFNRRIDKIQTCIVSAFTSAYIHNWSKYFDKPLSCLQQSNNQISEEFQLKAQKQQTQLPTFDARIVLYPDLQTVKDYFRWRQVDCHINNLYNTTFWCMMKSAAYQKAQNKGKVQKNTYIQNILKDTNSSRKNQILFSEFGINYNNIDAIYRRGTTLCYQKREDESMNGNRNKDMRKISKQLKTSIRELKDAVVNTDRILDKLQLYKQKQECTTDKKQNLQQKRAEQQFKQGTGAKLELQQGQERQKQIFRQLKQARQQLLGIKNKYENIDNKISEIKNESINKYAKNKDKSQNREVQKSKVQISKQQENIQDKKPNQCKEKQTKKQQRAQKNDQKTQKAEINIDGKKKKNIKENSKNKYKKVQQYILIECYEDMIKQQFWENIKIE